MLEGDNLPSMSKSTAAKRTKEAKIKMKKVYYDFNKPLTTAQNRKILKVIEDLDSIEAMFRKM